MKFLQLDKDFGVMTKVKDAYISKMNQIVMNVEEFSKDDALGNDYLTKCSVTLKLPILLFHGCVT